jgi:DNA-binding MarR family transcriptional regulator
MAAAADAATRAGAHRPYLRTLLLRRSEWIEARVLEAASRHGYGAVTPAMNRMFAHMRSRPVGMSDLARQLGISRQAVHELARQAEALGLVELLASERDARVKLVRFTAAGWKMSDCAARELDAIERALARQIGAAQLESLRRLLAMPWEPAETGRDAVATARR